MMKILDNVNLVRFVFLYYVVQNAHSSSEDSASEVEDFKENESVASSEEEKYSHKHSHIHRSGHRHKKSRSHSHDHVHDHDHDHEQRATSNEYDDCECACNKCDPPSDCCKSACQTCPSNPYQQPSQGMEGHSSVVFVPYPYPMMMPNPIARPAPNHHEMMRAHDSTTTQQPTTTSTTTPTTTTTTLTTTTTEYPTDLINSQNNNNMLEQVLKSVVDDYSNIIAKTPDKMNGNSKYMVTSLRRTKPTWMAKYGIVPISDNIAEKLLSKMSRARAPLRSQQRRVSMYDKSYLRTLAKKF